VPRPLLRAAALELAAQIAAKDPTVIRLAKEAFNGIDPWDVKRSYRYEQGYTFELNLSGVSDRLRESFGADHPGPDPLGRTDPSGSDAASGQE
jgi:enoyl-CoA hydratase